MSYSDPNRLDRIEALIEGNSQQISQLAQTTQFLTTSQLELARSVDVIARRMDGQAERTGQVEQQISLLAQSRWRARKLICCGTGIIACPLTKFKTSLTYLLLKDS